MIYQHPLAYLLAMEGRALLRAWAGDNGYDQGFVDARLMEIRRLLDDERLCNHPGVQVERDATATAYQQWAETYDDPGNGLFELDGPIIDEITRALPTSTAIDAGCGTGRVTATLARQGHRVIGVDSSPEMLHHARRRLPHTVLVTGDLRQLPVATNSTDLLVTALALTHVVDLRPVFGEFARVLRKGGNLVVSDVHDDLVLLGSVVKAMSPAGQPQIATTQRHTSGDFLRAALSYGFEVRRYEEEPRPKSGEAGPPPPEPTSDIGTWQEWPWTLHELIPEATRAAWNTPAVVVWHFQLAGSP